MLSIMLSIPQLDDVSWNIPITIYNLSMGLCATSKQRHEKDSHAPEKYATL